MSWLIVAVCVAAFVSALVFITDLIIKWLELKKEFYGLKHDVYNLRKAVGVLREEVSQGRINYLADKRQIIDRIQKCERSDVRTE